VLAALAELAVAMPARARDARPAAPMIAVVRRDRVNDVICDLSGERAKGVRT
jgi:hypothetical protein